MVNAWAKLILTIQPDCDELPVLIFTVPAVSEPLIDAVPPLPSGPLLTVRLGDGPVKLM